MEGRTSMFARVAAGSLLATVLAVFASGCDLPGRKIDTSASHAADSITAKARLDRPAGGGKALGLIVRCAIPSDSAGAYVAVAQLYQDRNRGPVAYASKRRRERSRTASATGEPIPFRSGGAATSIVLWFPGPEIRTHARSADAWVDILVSPAVADTNPPRWFRGEIGELRPDDFVAPLKRKKR